MMNEQNTHAAQAAHAMRPTHVITGMRTRFSYVSVWEPKSINGSTPKYSISLLIPKEDQETVARMTRPMQDFKRPGTQGRHAAVADERRPGAAEEQPGE